MGSAVALLRSWAQGCPSLRCPRLGSSCCVTTMSSSPTSCACLLITIPVDTASEKLPGSLAELHIHLLKVRSQEGIYSQLSTLTKGERWHKAPPHHPPSHSCIQGVCIEQLLCARSQNRLWEWLWGEHGGTVPTLSGGVGADRKLVRT